MNYEEKYKQALGWMRSLYKGLHGATKEDAEHYFPELKESEDERIKNEIIAFVEQSIHRGGGTPIPQEQENKWLTWLEKQGEQKIDNSNTMFNACINALRNVGHSHLADWLEKQGEQKPIKASYTTIVETGDGCINALVKRDLFTDGCYDEKNPSDKVEPKTLNADKVIAWLVGNIIDFEDYVRAFKKDFGL